MKKLLYFTIICTLSLLVGCEPNNPDKPSNNSNFSSKGFTVNEYGKKVVFSQGNLQYHPKNNLWRFAEKQTDFISDTIMLDYMDINNLNLSPSYDGWVDVFGWGTGANPTHASLDDFIDWGRNKIGNDAAGTWYTLSGDEWYYVTNERANAPFLIGVAQVDGVNGLILLPDDWECPKDIIFRSGFYDDYASFQTFTTEQWSKMEHAGAVFLPAAGSLSQDYDYYNYVNFLVLENVGTHGFYWTRGGKNTLRFDCLGVALDYLPASTTNYGYPTLGPGYFCKGRVRLVKTYLDGYR